MGPPKHETKTKLGCERQAWERRRACGQPCLPASRDASNSGVYGPPPRAQDRTGAQGPSVCSASHEARPYQEDPEGCVPRHGASLVLTGRAALGLERQQQWAEVPGGAFHRCPRACPRCHLSPHLNHTPTGLQGAVSGVGEGKRHNAGDCHKRVPGPQCPKRTQAVDQTPLCKPPS